MSPPSPWTCRRCAAPTAAEFAYCVACGAARSAGTSAVVLRFCLQCGAQLSVGRDFCTHCGRRREDVPATEAAVGPPPPGLQQAAPVPAGVPTPQPVPVHAGRGRRRQRVAVLALTALLTTLGLLTGVGAVDDEPSETLDLAPVEPR